MGATDFYQTATGKTAREAFNNAVKQAQWDYGHAGYTGTIAEKDGFEEVILPDDIDPTEFLRWVKRTAAEQVQDVPVHVKYHVDRAAKKYDDKWGPAVCVKLEDGVYAFTGWASC